MREEFFVESSREEELIEITYEVEKIVKKANIKEGMCHIYIPHATAGVILNESADPNIKIDFLNAINKTIPRRGGYLHDRIDNNAHAHIKSAIVGASTSIPIINGRLSLGTWQSIMVCEFDGPRKRRVVVQVFSL
jgi:secondary thiamine-phosphate synthase enzyme